KGFWTDFEITSVNFLKPLKLPPVVRIVSPTQGSASSSDTAKIIVEADDQGGGVEDIRLYQNGKLIEDTTRQLTHEKGSKTRGFEVNLVPGVNTFRATAFNTDRTEARPDEVKIELKAMEATADLYMLSVGLNEYQNSNFNLNYGKADAQAFADAVELRGNTIFREIKKKVIFDADASNGGIKKAFEDIIKQARPQDVFVFFYAGHGVMSEGDEKTASDFYLVPYEVIRLFGDGGNLIKSGIAATDLREMLRKVRALKQLIIIDACQSGGAVETIAIRGVSDQKALMQLARSAGVAVLASAGQDQVATEFSKLGHGVFTYALLKGLSGEADGSPTDGKVTVKELAAYLDDQVPELTKLHRGKLQYPHSSTRGQDFPIGIK
ncbi:MAG: caspase family protein, partial [Pyrinomonadaceae bacterium]